jgi:hypothetical protein
MTLYVLALNRGIQEIIPEGCSVIGCGFAFGNGLIVDTKFL